MRQLSYRDYNMSELRDGDMISVKLVCVLGCDNDYAVYLGTTDQSDEEVAREGNKVFAGDTVGHALFRTAVENRHYRR